jgi:predicted phage baseplate assembly protein
MRSCGCCEGTEAVTPLSVENRPGLDSLAYRVGTHAAFLESMLARLSNRSPALDPVTGESSKESIQPLLRLRARTSDDPAVALLDGWATVADVLTFYQERIANEGFLRTATERRSILELARLIGYRLRPGVSGSVYLAFTVDDALAAAISGAPGPPLTDSVTGPSATGGGKSFTLIPKGTAVQSVPMPGELPQTFETADPLVARSDWNRLIPRQTEPQLILPNIGVGKAAANGDGPTAPTHLYFAGTETNLKPNDRLLLGGSVERQELHEVKAVRADPPNDRTEVELVALEGVGGLGPVAALIDLIDRHLDLEAFRIEPSREMAVRVVELLQGSRDRLTEHPSEAIVSAIVDEILTSLAEEHAIAVEGAYTVLEPWVKSAIQAVEGLAEVMSGLPADVSGTEAGGILALVDPLSKRTSLQPVGPLALSRSVDQALAPGADAASRLLAVLRPELRDMLYQAWESQPATPASSAGVFAFDLRASLFGHNAPDTTQSLNLSLSRSWGEHEEGELRTEVRLGTTTAEFAASFEDAYPRDIELPALQETVTLNLEGDLSDLTVTYLFAKLGVQIAVSWRPGEQAVAKSTGMDPATLEVNEPSEQEGTLAVAGSIGSSFALSEEPNVLFLDAPYEGIAQGSWVAVERPFAGDDVPRVVVAHAIEVSEASRANYGMAGKGTRIVLDRDWLADDEPFSVIRGTIVHAAAHMLGLAGAPIQGDVCGDRIELDRLLEGLDAGRWLLVTGERADIPNVAGIRATELVMLAGVEQGFDQELPGEHVHSTLRLANGLAYCYKRDTVIIFGNVVEADHGETRSQVLGSGDGSKAWQRFMLAQSPLTHVASETPSGTTSTLQVRVNDVLWHEADAVTKLDPGDHGYITSTDDDARTAVMTGDGDRYGARLPTGVENVRAVYRVGIGRSGNLKAGQLSQPISRPLGLKAVINPLPATGGADSDSRDQARRNAPKAVTALDRLVSVKDYEDFAQTFAGVGKASATRLTDGRRRVVHVTIAGADDIPIAPSSALFRALVGALNRFGDPHIPVQVAFRERLVLVVGARVRVLPDYAWESVEPKVRMALLDRFGFDGRELGEDIPGSEVIATIQRVAGVDFVDLDALQANSEADLATLLQMSGGNGAPSPTPAAPARIAVSLARFTGHTILPAQIAYVPPDVADALILTEITQ